MSSATHAIASAKRYIARKCGQGDACACATGKRVMVAESLSIMAGSVAELMSFKVDKGHPNQLPFRGVLLTLNQSSTKPPHGSRGHRIYVPTEVARKHLTGLIGMAVNYDPQDLDSHETRHKVGIITKAGITGNQVWVKGIIWKKDFPEAVGKLSGRSDLGMSMELANVYVRDEKEDVWHLEDFEFTGATILKKSAAAYYSTELSATSEKKSTVLAATAAAASGKSSKGEVMPQTKAKARVAAASNSGGNGALLVGAIKNALTEAVAPLVRELRASSERQSKLEADYEELKGLHLINASAEGPGDEDEEDDAAIAAAAHEDDEDDMEAGGDKKDKNDDEDDEDEDDNDDDEGEQDDLAAELENLSIDPADEEPGEVNEHRGGENKGDKTTVTNPPTQKEHLKGNIAKGRLKSAASKKRLFPALKSSSTSIQAAAVMVETLRAQAENARRKNKQLVKLVGDVKAAADKKIKKLSTQVETLQAQVERHAESVDRRSAATVPVEIRNLLAKAQADPREIMAGSAEKLTVDAVDRVFGVLANEGVIIEPVKRAEYKNRMVELGLMANGEERYGVN